MVISKHHTTVLGIVYLLTFFEYNLKGPSITLFVLSYSEQYNGGCIFVDYASVYLHIEHKLGL